MLVKHSRNVIIGCGSASNLLPFCFGVLHAASHSRPDDCQLKLCEDRAHLDERLAHGVYLPVPAVNRDTAHDDEPEFLALDDLHNLTELLCASGQAADLKRDDGVTLSRRIEKHMKVLLDLRIATFILKDHLQRAIDVVNIAEEVTVEIIKDIHQVFAENGRKIRAHHANLQSLGLAPLVTSPVM